MVNAFKYTDVSFVTKNSSFDLNYNVIGANHEYVKDFNDLYKTVFSLKKNTLPEIKKGNYNLNDYCGYSIDPFEANFNYPKKFKNKNYILSVIIPTYNNGKFLLGKAFASLLRSSIFKQMHIIIIDDGSDDADTIYIIKELTKSYSNVTSYFLMTAEVEVPLEHEIKELN